MIVTVAALTAPLNVVPPDCVISRVPVPRLAVLAVTVPVVLRVKPDPAPPLLTDPKVIAFAIPVPTVSVNPLLIVASPSVIAPVDAPPTVAFAVTVTGVVPRLIAPVPNAEIVPAINLLLGAVAITPAVNWVLSPAASPSVSVPALAILTLAVVMVVVKE